MGEEAEPNAGAEVQRPVLIEAWPGYFVIEATGRLVIKATGITPGNVTLPEGEQTVHLGVPVIPQEAIDAIVAIRTELGFTNPFPPASPPGVAQ